MAGANTLIEASGLACHYGDTHAVDGVDLEVRQGDVLGLLGPNGAGKSSTLGMICGTLAPTAGRVRIAGVDLIESPRRAKRALGYLPEEPPLYPEMSVAEYLHFCAGLRGLRGSARHRALDAAIERCSLGEMRHRVIARLSKGYRQRTGVAQAILHAPAAIVLDEPTVGLDPIQVREIRDLIAGLATEHAVILSTHILPEVQAVCSHVHIMHRGRIAWRDTLNTPTAARASGAVRVALTGDVALPHDLPGVTAVETLGSGRYRLELETAPEPVPRLAAALVEAGCGLLELVPETRSLEQVFVEVTATDVTATEEAAASQGQAA